MRGVVGGARLAVFGRAIHAIARISDELWFDPVEKGLSLRSVNASRSAYACVFFSSMFFQRYSCRNAPEIYPNKNGIHFAYKLVIKAVLPVFRCLNTLEKNVEKCNIYVNVIDSYVVFQLFCKHGVVKTHNLTFQESEPLQAVFAKHLCPNVLKFQSRQLSDILMHFPTSQDEITLAVTPMKVCFKTYMEDEMDFAKAMHTEIHLTPEEFEYLQVGVNSEVTFCLKELRGLLVSAEALCAPISVHFDISGKPIAFSIEDTVVEASFVLATLADTENRTSSHHSPHLSHIHKRSPALKRSKKDIETATNTADNLIPTEEVVPPAPYEEFHSLFFGAVLSKAQDVGHVFHSLATASDTEEELSNGQISQAF
ncbi:cell cycle checkpoint control protein RAD9B [Tiliqua scincoides]|uniref:cell cycle checkpoint control protein RAD9B n=1 Tax=Tiliqua scincoides TaxID=71010 RepID=UPI0034635FF2